MYFMLLILLCSASENKQKELKLCVWITMNKYDASSLLK